MNRIEEIKGRISKLPEAPWDFMYNDDFHRSGYNVADKNKVILAECVNDAALASYFSNSLDDIQYLLSRLEIAEKALERIGKNEAYDETPQDIVEKALQQIRS